MVSAIMNSLTSTKFQPGDVVVCLEPRGYNVTRGKRYTVTVVKPPETFAGFRYPEYVGFLDDTGRQCSAHTYRFEKVQS